MPFITPSQATVAYLTAGVCFILSLGGLSRQETARRGNWLGVLGMLIAFGATAMQPEIKRWELIGGAVIVGGLIGAVMAKKVVMTAMPELVALLHSFVGLAAVLVGLSSYLGGADETLSHTEHGIHLVEIWIGIAVGAITFTGSIIAFLSLDGRMSGAPIMLPMRHAINLGIAVLVVVLVAAFVIGQSHTLFWVITALALLFGILIIIPIGGADMPVVISMLNSYSGWAAAGIGFTLGNTALIITGALVGSSGAILSYIMCQAMNRSFISVIRGGFRRQPAGPAGGGGDGPATAGAGRWRGAGPGSSTPVAS